MMSDLTARYSSKDVEVVAADPVYQGIFQISQLKLRHRLHRGGWSEVFTRELFQRGQAVGVLPYDPRRDEVVLLEQFRVGALTDPQSPWLFEIAAGMIDEGESPPQTAEREMLEETGLECLDLMPIMEYWISPGGSDEKMWLFCANVDASQASGLHGMADEHEEIRVFTLPRQTVMEQLAAGKFRNAPVVLALQWLALNLTEIKQTWASS